MLSITGVMVLPAYFASCAYLWKLCEDGEYPTGLPEKRSSALFTSILGTIYALWLIYAAGLNYLLMAVVIVTLGIPVYIWARKESSPEQPLFTPKEACLAGLFIILSLWAIYAFTHGLVKI